MRWPHRPDDGGPRWQCGRNSIGGRQEAPLADCLARVGGGVQLAGWRVSGLVAASGREWQGSQSCQGATELVFPRPALVKIKREASRRAGEPSGHKEEASSEGLGGYQLLDQTDARCPACQVVGDHLDREPGGVGGEAARLRDRRSLGILENPRVGGFT